MNERTFSVVISAVQRAGMHGTVLRCVNAAESVRLNWFVLAAVLLKRALEVVEGTGTVEPDSFTLAQVFQLCGAAGPCHTGLRSRLLAVLSVQLSACAHADPWTSRVSRAIAHGVSNTQVHDLKRQSNRTKHKSSKHKRSVTCSQHAAPVRGASGRSFRESPCSSHPSCPSARLGRSAMDDTTSTAY